MNAQRKQTIIKALTDGINAARLHSDELKMQLKDVEWILKYSLIPDGIKAEIETMDDWIVELADALHWLTGNELTEMQTLHAVSTNVDGHDV